MLRHKGTLPLETDRLYLRPMEIADAQEAYANWCADTEVTRFLRWPAHGSLADTKAVLKRWVDSYQDPAFYQWGIEIREMGQLIGTISVVDRDETTGTLQIGYCIGTPWWHQGYTSEAFQRVIQFLFDQVGALRIECQHDPNNPHSGRVMAKCGLQYEGTLRQRDWSNQGIVDACMYSLLREEYLQGGEKARNHGVLGG